MGCKTRKYSDGGKVMEREYGGKPTFLKAVAANFGVGDGYSYRPKKSAPQRMNVGNASETLGSVVSKRKKMLDDV